MTDKYVLDEQHNIHAQPNIQKWGKWFETNSNRIVNQQMVGGVRVSTVFLGLDHDFSGEGPPILFETMIFGGKHDQDQQRCCTWDQALAMHQRMLEKVR